MEQNFHERNSVYFAWFSSFLKILEMPFHLSLEIAGNANRNFFVIWKAHKI